MMQEVKLYRLENYIKEKCESSVATEPGATDTKPFLRPYVTGGALSKQPYVIVGEPGEKLLELQNAGYCVLAELKHLQGLSEDEVAEALGGEEAVTQYKNVCIDAEELPQAYLLRLWCRYLGEPVLIAETDRLIIRESVEEDAEAFLELYQDEACQKFLEIPPVAFHGDKSADIAEYRRYIAQYRAGQYAFYEYGMWSVVEKASGRCVGRVGLELQSVDVRGAMALHEDARTKEEVLCLGYALLPEYRGKGYATEACLAVLDYCRECEYAEKVYVKIEEANVRSGKVYERLAEKSAVIKVI